MCNLAYRGAAAFAVLLAIGWGRAQGDCPGGCGDLNADQLVSLSDFDLLAGCLGESAEPACQCSDLDGSGSVDLRDYAIFTLTFGLSPDESPPDCTGAGGTTAEFTAYRPQFGSGYFPFARTPVPDDLEENPTRGPGIRRNGPGDADPAGEDDLIEVTLAWSPPGPVVALRRSSDALRVWTTRNKQAGTEIVFVGDRAGVLGAGPADSSRTLWVEWATTDVGTCALQVEPLEGSVAKDRLVFHVFEGLVVALGGEDQAPTLPVDSNHGTYVVGTALYQLGYDVLMMDEDNVGADGSGPAYDHVADAILRRGVTEVAIFGYSHGGGSTYDLAELLDNRRAQLGIFGIAYTSYVDSVSNNSDFDIGQELRRPPSTAYHLNHYQRGVFFEDLGLDGGPVPDSNPPPTGLDVETTPWGAGVTHFGVDDLVQVRSAMESTLTPLLKR